MTRTTTLIVLSAAALIAANGDLGAQRHDYPPQLTALRRDLVAAKSPADARKALAALFGPARTNRQWLAWLQADSDAGVALQAAWEAAKDPGGAWRHAPSDSSASWRGGSACDHQCVGRWTSWPGASATDAPP